MLRYIFLSVFALLLLTACGDSLTDKEGGQEPVTDTSSQDLNKVFGNPSGVASVSNGAISVGAKKSYFGSRIGREQLVNAFSSEHDLTGVILSGIDLSGVDLSYANLSAANLTGANLSRANLSGLDLSEFFLARVDLTGAS
jgi:uncharacterized protein YjbI with pentapeptide repeats